MVMVVVIVVKECTSSDYGGALLLESRSNTSRHTVLYSIRHVASISPMAGDRNMLGQKGSCHHQHHYQHTSNITT